MKNQAKGYNEQKENLKLPNINDRSQLPGVNDKSSLILPHQDKSYLQNRGAAILAAGNKYVNQSNIVNNQR